MRTESLLDLFDHMTWADSKVWCEVLDNTQAIHDEKLHRLLSHIHGVQHFYLRAWRNDPLEAPNPEFDQLPDLYNRAKDYYVEAPDISHHSPMPYLMSQCLRHGKRG